MSYTVTVDIPPWEDSGPSTLTRSFRHPRRRLSVTSFMRDTIGDLKPDDLYVALYTIVQDLGLGAELFPAFPMDQDPGSNALRIVAAQPNPRALLSHLMREIPVSDIIPTGATELITDLLHTPFFLIENSPKTVVDATHSVVASGPAILHLVATHDGLVSVLLLAGSLFVVHAVPPIARSFGDAIGESLEDILRRNKRQGRDKDK